MVHLHIITVNVIMLFFHIYNNESVENKRSLHLPKRPELPERPRNTGKTIQKDIWLKELAYGMLNL